jgi:hypothetical protein
MSKKQNSYDTIGKRFNRNNEAAGEAFEKFTNAGQVVNYIVEHPEKRPTLAEIVAGKGSGKKRLRS